MELHFTALTCDELVRAHEMYDKKESRANDYWVARERSQIGIRDRNSGEIAEAIAALLKSWHKEYYRWRPAKAKSLVAELRELIIEQSEMLAELHARSLSELDASDRPAVLRLFSFFEGKLGPVGTAKALNLLAPNFFPLWDSDIASEYGVSLGPHGYFLFMAVTAHRVRNLHSGRLPDGMDLLKSLDVYNYCRYTKGWIT